MGFSFFGSKKLKTDKPVRKVLWSGGIVSVKIPANAEPGAFGEIHYLTFPRFIKGGVVKCFVHTTTGVPIAVGKRIKAEAKVMKRSHDDGREYLYIDYRPVEFERVVTNRVTVQNDDVRLEAGWKTFEVNEPLRAVIIVAPADAKVVVKGNLA